MSTPQGFTNDYIYIQLTLEQHGFELCGSIYRQIVFQCIHTTVLHSLLLVDSADAELQIWRAHSKIVCRFLTVHCVCVCTHTHMHIDMCVSIYMNIIQP